MSAPKLMPAPRRNVQLQRSVFQSRFDLNYRYLMSLKEENLLQNYYQEAGLWAPRQHPEGIHWGWESPTCQVRGHFLGHWLSAAARIWAHTGDAQIKAKADHIVAELARCQRENGGEWAGSIPPTYLEWIARGKAVWAPHYTLHKTMMGLIEMHTLAGNAQALEIMQRWAEWFYRWTGQFSRAQMDDILDVETGGMLEVWADLYALTGDPRHLELLRRYDRPRLFQPLLDGQDPLTNKHANTTIPEVQGAARAWEVTGEARWREIVEAYWRCAVTDRGYYCTGGQTCGEVWTPPYEFAARLGDKNQEHCVVYNMMRLADYLFRWTGDASYADYRERNLYNGILAQQHPRTGMITYFLPLQAGARKTWGTPTDHFWCCHGSLVQAHASHADGIYYAGEDGLTIAQYIPSTLHWEWQGVPVEVSLTPDPQIARTHRPDAVAVRVSVRAAQPVAFALHVRLPWWLSATPTIAVNGARQDVPHAPTSFVALQRTWHEDEVYIALPKRPYTCPLPDAPEMVAFMDGPVVLAGLCDEEITLCGDPAHPEAILTPDNEREWAYWRYDYRTRGQPRNIRFTPLHEVVDERYTVYFPLRERA